MSNVEAGEPGNLVLAGHRTSWFLPIKDLNVGDAVVIESRDRETGRRIRRRYQVELTKVIQPEDVTFLRPRTRDVLTLLTCYPFGLSPTSPQRYVVRAGATEARNDSARQSHVWDEPLGAFPGPVASSSLTAD